ncbi:DNA-directed RNA polymerase sigma-70 factor [Cytophagales bacterium WSM2-2]|nr:DNA-directed RNA polymerase sigma-70 factor [Cytophagales bacterium WSM2-2]
MLDDASLILQLNTGDKEAFETIYDRYSVDLYKFIFSRIRIKEISEEIVQEIFVSLWAKRESLKIASLSAYLFSASKYQILTYIRSDKVRKRYAAEFVLYLSGRHDNSIEEFINTSDLNSLIEKAITELPEKCQQVFRMSRFEHLTIKEIAERLNISTRTVENYITQSLRHLRLSLGEFLAFLLWLSIYNK